MLMLSCEELVISAIQHKLCFFSALSFVGNRLLFQSFWFILNMMHPCSWETGFKIKGDKQIFGCLDWLCEQCWLAVGYPDQLSANKLIQLFNLHTLWRCDTQEPWMMNVWIRKLLPWRPDHLERPSEVQEGDSRIWALKTWLSTELEEGTIVNIFHTFCTWEVMHIKGTHEMWTFSLLDLLL